MARTRTENYYRIVEWNVEQEYGKLWKPKHPDLPFLRPYKSLVLQSTQREIIDEIVKAKAEMEAQGAQVTAGKDGASTSGNSSCDAIIEVLMRTELFARHDEVYGEQTRVDLVVKNVDNVPMGWTTRS